MGIAGARGVDLAGGLAELALEIQPEDRVAAGRHEGERNDERSPHPRRISTAPRADKPGGRAPAHASKRAAIASNAA